MTTTRLSLEEEIELGKRIASGDTTAFHKLIEANLHLVDPIARKHQNPIIPLEDLIQEGRIGLVEAASKFDYRRGCKFSTYATPLIRKAIQVALRKSSGFTGLPDHLRKIGKVNSIYVELCQILQREPQFIEIADKLDLTSKEVEEVLLFKDGFISMDSPINEEQPEIMFGETLADYSVDIEKELSNQELISKLQYDQVPISDREIEIIRLQFFEKLKGIEIAKRMGISSARVTQISKSALEKLRIYFSDFNKFQSNFE